VFINSRQFSIMCRTTALTLDDAGKSTELNLLRQSDQLVRLSVGLRRR
jgi:hypothetical protein